MTTARRLGLETLTVVVIAFSVTAPTAGDLGLTWDEPAYRYSQMVSAQWWERLAEARSRANVADLLDPDALLYYWPYGRHGINFHPPLAGQLDLLTFSLLEGWWKEIPARRLASVLEYALTIGVLYLFLRNRYGFWAGFTAAGALLTMPRVHGHALLAGTDMPGLWLWTLTALAAWKGLNEPNARRWRVAAGALLGLCFLVKMAAVMVLLPILGWLAIARLPRSFMRGGRASWLDGLASTAFLVAPLAIGFAEILRLSAQMPEPQYTDLFFVRPESRWFGALLAAPSLFWFARRGFGAWLSGSRIWGVERPALELWEALIAFPPLVGWLGNPAWWRETLPRLAHYYQLSVGREGALPDIRIYYLGETYLFSLPWHNAWVLIGVTVPVTVLTAALVGILRAFATLRTDRLPTYLLVQFLAFPVLRMLPTPAHDGVRLFLPTFVFLAALAGLGVSALGRIAGGAKRSGWVSGVLTAVVVGWSAIQLVSIHPYELSYYNRLIGGPQGAWKRGFELSYWYDAFNPQVLDNINKTLPQGEAVRAANRYSMTPTFAELQALGELRPDLRIGAVPATGFPAQWLLTHDSKAGEGSRAIFAMTPMSESRPEQLDRRRVASVAGPKAVARGWALWLLAGDERPPESVQAPLPDWARAALPWLSRFWGEGLTKAPVPVPFEPVFAWASSDPESLRAAARSVSAGRLDTPEARRLRAILERFDDQAREGPYSEILLFRDPEALVEAVEILIERPEDVRRVLSSAGYVDLGPGRELDRSLND